MPISSTIQPICPPSSSRSCAAKRLRCMARERWLDPGRPWHSPYRIAVSLLNWQSRILYGHRLTDQSTCYKAMPTALWHSLNLQSERFELCAEITAKLGRLRLPIREVAIRYRPRSRAEGKEDRLARRGFSGMDIDSLAISEHERSDRWRSADSRHEAREGHGTAPGSAAQLPWLDSGIGRIAFTSSAPPPSTRRSGTLRRSRRRFCCRRSWR